MPFHLSEIPWTSVVKPAYGCHTFLLLIAIFRFAALYREGPA